MLRIPSYYIHWLKMQPCFHSECLNVRAWPFLLLLDHKTHSAPHISFTEWLLRVYGFIAVVFKLNYITGSWNIHGRLCKRWLVKGPSKWIVPSCNSCQRYCWGSGGNWRASSWFCLRLLFCPKLEDPDAYAVVVCMWNHWRCRTELHLRLCHSVNPFQLFSTTLGRSEAI